VSETTRLVVGADGRHSAVAKAVSAPAYHVKPALSTAYYTYWSGVELAGGEIYGRTCINRLVGAWPTNDGLVMTYVAAPASEFHAFRADPDGSILAALDRCGDLGERVRAGERADRVFGTADTQNRFHVPHGPGWALVGDAGLVMDPATGAGIADAFRDAELLTDAVAAGLDGGPPLPEALAGYQAARDAAALPMYEMTTDLASFAPPRPEQEMLLRALEGNQPEIDRFLSVLTGSLPAPEYFTPRRMLRLIGVRGVWQAMRSQRKMRA
jgi:2-polyprenyl-6-methoxyphenol hydroxylase-like FAD-dependent oxidoreductase